MNAAILRRFKRAAKQDAQHRARRAQVEAVRAAKRTESIPPKEVRT